jgi:RimJ/RimL family protein N-acetyltransferase
VDWLEDRNRIDLVTLLDGVVTGIASLQQGERHQHHLGEISVAIHPDHRRSGSAGVLIGEIESRASDVGVNIIKAMIWVENHPSRKLFESLGYEHKATLMAEFKSETFGEIDDAVYYKRLTI